MPDLFICIKKTACKKAVYTYIQIFIKSKNLLSYYSQGDNNALTRWAISGSPVQIIIS